MATPSGTPSSRTRSAPKSAEPHLTRWETVGAWLHVWTPPKGIDVPVVPWRKLAVWGLVAALVLASAAAIAVPRIDETKKRGAADRAREAAAADAAERARLRADQRVHRATVQADTDLVAALEQAVKADANARAVAGTIKGPVLSTKCEYTSADVTQFPNSRVYKCFVKTAAGVPGQDGDVLGTGYPFVATIYAKTRQLAWCKQNPHADEKGTKGDVRVRTSPVCAGKLAEVL